MAYNIVSSAEFKPISYSDIVAPLVQYRDEYQRVEDIYSQLLEKTLPWKAELEGYAGSDAYNTYNNFYNELNAAMEDFSKGMTTENAKGLLKLKRRHLSDIYPIERAVKKIDEWEKFKADIKRSNPYAEFAQDSVSIDDVIKGVKPNKDYWDGNAAMQRVTAKAAALAKSLYSNPIDKGLWLGDQYYKIETLNGMPVEEFMAVLQDPRNADTEAAKMMGKILTDELDLIDRNSFSDQTYNRILNTLNTAMYAGLANPKYENVGNRNFASYIEKRQAAIREEQWALEQNKQDKIDGKIPFYKQSNSDGSITMYFNNPATRKVDVYKVNANGELISKEKSTNFSYYGDTGRSSSPGGSETSRVNRMADAIILDGEGKVYGSGEDVVLNKSFKSVKYSDLSSYPELKAIAEAKVGNDPDGYDYYLVDTNRWGKETDYTRIAIIPREPKVVDSTGTLTPEQLNEILREAQGG